MEYLSTNVLEVWQNGSSSQFLPKLTCGSPPQCYRQLCAATGPLKVCTVSPAASTPLIGAALDV